MHKFLLLIILGLFTSFNSLEDVTFGVEICDNGIDDDNNGFIDCFDSACDCSRLCATNYYTKCDTGCVLDNKESSFEMKLKWETTSTVWHEYTIPIVADLDGDGDPEIIGKSGPILGFRKRLTKNFQIFDGVTGQLENTFITPYLHYKFSAPAVGDVDKNGTPEIFYITADTDMNIQRKRLICFEYQNGFYKQKWVSNRAIDRSSLILQGPPSLADFNQDGRPEVYVGNYIFDAQTGVFLTKGKATDNVGNYDHSTFHHRPSFVVAVDVLEDGFCTNCEGLELVAGNQVFSVDINGASSRLNLEVTGDFGNDGFTSIADMDHDGDLDAVVVWRSGNQGKISVWDLQTSASIGNTYSFGGGNDYSLANIADFNGDGFPEIGVTTNNSYRVIGFNGSRWIKLWQKSSYDQSGQTGSTVFDFNGDGQFEVVYRDEFDLSVFDGATGAILFTAPCASGTGTEYPVVADVDGDGETELLCGCHNELRLWGSANLPWVPSRKIWNQHMYFNVNINDDLTIPIQQQSHHIVGDSIEMNTFLAQYGDTRFPAADAFINIDSVQCKKDVYEIFLTICNIGSKILSKSTPITIYNSDPTTTRAIKIKTFVLGENIDLSECIEITVTISKSTKGKLHFIVNDDGSKTTPFSLKDDFPVTSIAECDFLNNIDTVSLEYTIGTLELGKDQYWCDIDTTTLDAGDGFLSYLWQDGSTDQTIIAQNPGWYIVEVLDECDDVHIDSLYISFSFSESNFDTLFICPGDTVVVFDEDIFEAGDRSKVFSNIQQCDSTVYTNIVLKEGYLEHERIVLCADDSVFFNNNWINKTGRSKYTNKSFNACDSVFILDVLILDPIIARSSDTIVCHSSDSSQITLDILGGIGPPYLIDWGSGTFDTSSSKILNVGLHHLGIMDEMGCLNEMNLRIINRPVPIIKIDINNVICYGDSNGQIILTILDPSRNWTYSINGSKFTSSTQFPNLKAGSYLINMKDEYNCSYDTILSIDQPLEMDLFLPPDTTIELGQNIEIKSSTSLNEMDLIYKWMPDVNLECNDCPIINVRPLNTTTYTLTITDHNGCTITREITIYVKVIWNVYVPNVFSPNGDGINDGLTVFTSASVKEVISLDIYDRWGELVFHGGPFAPNEPTNGWDGTLNNEPLNPGVFVYVAQVRLLNDEVHSVSGDVTLVR